MATDLYAALEQAIPATRAEFETLLRELVQIPTVSMDPAHASDIQQGAHQAAAILQACGATVEIVETPGNPVVFGQLAVNPDDLPEDGTSIREPGFGFSTRLDQGELIDRQRVTLLLKRLPGRRVRKRGYGKHRESSMRGPSSQLDPRP